MISLEKLESIRAKDRTHYANMTPNQKHTKMALRASARNTLSKDSIAMENPLYIPKIVRDGSIPTCDWSIPEVSGTLVYIQSASEQMSDGETHDMDVSEISRRKHITHGERHALMCRRNEAFYESTKKNETPSMDETSSMNLEGVNGSEHQTQSIIVNNGNVLPLLL